MNRRDVLKTIAAIPLVGGLLVRRRAEAHGVGHGYTVSDVKHRGWFSITARRDHPSGRQWKVARMRVEYGFEEAGEALVESVRILRRRWDHLQVDLGPGVFDTKGEIRRLTGNKYLQFGNGGNKMIHVPSGFEFIAFGSTKSRAEQFGLCETTII
jgi:hypothetical protein